VKAPSAEGNETGMGFTNRALTSDHPGSAVVMFKIASVAIEVAARPRVIMALVV
jgi:hypothetical protein